MTISLKEALDLSIIRWDRILADYPDVKVRSAGGIPIPDKDIYGNCGMCTRYSPPPCTTEGNEICPLKDTYCTDYVSSALFWKIGWKLSTREDCRDLIEKMLNKLKELRKGIQKE